MSFSKYLEMASGDEYIGQELKAAKDVNFGLLIDWLNMESAKETYKEGKQTEEAVRKIERKKKLNR